LTYDHDTVDAANGRNVSVKISEILVSASSESYNGTDWNNDGDIGSSSDQFIELWNAGSEPVDVSDWLLDDVTDGGSAPCRLAWNTTIQPNDHIVIFRASSRIEFDYWDGDTATISDAAGNLVDTLSYPAEDSWWDFSYVKAANGTVSKVKPPTPGWGEGEDHATAQNMVRCYGLNDNVHSGAYVLKGRIVPMTGEADVMNEGHLLVKDGMIEAVWENDVPADIQLTNVPVIETNGTIYPGMLDLHNHLHYNQAPLWDMTPHLPENNRNAWGGYNNRYEWKNHPDYSEYVTKPKMLVHSGPYWNMESQAMKYIEMKSLVGGATAAQGGPSNPDDSYATVLSRNIEDYNFGRDEIHTKVTELTSDYVGNHIKTGNASGELDAWFIHIAEGVDERSRAEFDILVQNNLLVGELVLIHGVALTDREFTKMAEVGATLVWSPLSNLLLYGQTADIAAAKAAGVHITLAPDWAPSGSKSPLHELKVADLWDDEMLGDIFTDYELVSMVTDGAAQATNWDTEVG
ncbi:MAG: lamin tail domain-containing protein, partial [Candidatus Thermoplasmatota archaeon]|nr:lamin tail domain-containing protein [Candidatus Thermoplasmatota archaeon]